MRLHVELEAHLGAQDDDGDGLDDGANQLKGLVDKEEGVGLAGPGSVVCHGQGEARVANEGNANGANDGSGASGG